MPPTPSRLRRLLRPALLAGLLALALTATPAPADPPGGIDPPSGIGRPAPPPTDRRPAGVERLEQRALAAVASGDLRRAEALLGEALEREPKSPSLLYNLACVLARRGQIDRAAQTLFRAVQSGFRNFAHMRTDPDLDAIRATEMYRAIDTAAAKTSSNRAVDALARWRRTYGEDDYRYETDERHRLTYATALDIEAHTAMRRMLEAQADHLVATLFGAPPQDYVLIAIPTPGHADALFGGDAGIGGRYEHKSRRLVARDIGSSLRHEFFHAYHYGHMERLGLRKPHALWIQEGMAALYEDYELRADGTIRFLPNERTNVTIRRVKIGRAPKFKDFFALSADGFMARPLQTYPQAREIFRWVAEEGRLVEWYRTYVETYTDDPTGVIAFERTFGAALDVLDKRWRAWMKAQPMLDNRVDYGDAALGVLSSSGQANDGVVIGELVPGSAAARSRLRPRDVITAVDGIPTPSLDALQRVIAARSVGDTVEVRYRRNGRYQTTRVTLRPLR